MSGLWQNQASWFVVTGSDFEIDAHNSGGIQGNGQVFPALFARRMNTNLIASRPGGRILQVMLKRMAMDALSRLPYGRYPEESSKDSV